MVERNYQFRERLLQVHKPDRRDWNVVPAKGQILVDDSWQICISKNAERVIVTAAKDMQDYLGASMGVELPLKRCQDIAAAAKEEKKLVLATVAELGEDAELDEPKSYRLTVGSNIVVNGFDARGAAQGWYFIEDLMNLESAPILDTRTLVRKSIFSPRMSHSGYGLDMFPDQYLAHLTHLGIDAILVFTKAANKTPFGFCDFNELIYRAEGYGLDVYAYSYLKSERHPDDKDAAAYYDNMYGTVFKKCPGLKGIVMVGESVEFPSKDKRTTGRSFRIPNPDGLPDEKPTPGWFPCYDYPQWVSLIRDTVHKYSPNADIVLWTYNWGYVEEEYRLEMLRNLPTDITLLVTFEMFEKVRTGNVTSTCVDYTLSIPGPGKYFSSEAKLAKERGIKLYSQCNSGGLTWDIGVIPYLPTPSLWAGRMNALKKAHDDWGLSGLMENHHYGLWPSVISEMGKWLYWTPAPEPEEILYKLAKRNFTEALAQQALEVWKLWCEGFSHYFSANEDQYGPFRVGPAYPLSIARRGKMNIPEEDYASFGSRICMTDYYPHERGRVSLGNFRFPHEIQELTEMKRLFDEGNKLLESIVDQLTGWRKKDAEYMLNLGRFISHCCTTTVHTKQFYIGISKIFSSTDESEIRETVAKLQAICDEEIRNAEETIPLVEFDSRLGWEPSMEYMTDRAHLEWKIKATGITRNQLNTYVDSLQYNFTD